MTRLKSLLYNFFVLTSFCFVLVSYTRSKILLDQKSIYSNTTVYSKLLPASHLVRIRFRKCQIYVKFTNSIGLTHTASHQIFFTKTTFISTIMNIHNAENLTCIWFMNLPDPIYAHPCTLIINITAISSLFLLRCLILHVLLSRGVMLMSQLLVHSSEYEVYLESRGIFTCKHFVHTLLFLYLAAVFKKHVNCKRKKLIKTN